MKRIFVSQAAGKHVLCEKPMASNAEESEQMKACAHRYNRVLEEAYHWRYHPIYDRVAGQSIFHFSSLYSSP